MKNIGDVGPLDGADAELRRGRGCKRDAHGRGQKNQGGAFHWVAPLEMCEAGKNFITAAG